VRLLQDSWQTTLAGPRKPILRVDLTGVTSIDAAGQACLAAMHRGGVEFIAADCVTKAVLAEITQGPSPKSDCGHPKGRIDFEKVSESNARFHIGYTFARRSHHVRP
jgi:hypothetical protein